MKHTFSLTRLAAAATMSAMLVACGGGGSDTPDVPAVPVDPPTPQPTYVEYVEVPLQNTLPQHSYKLDSAEARAFDKLNRARTECGLGSMSHDTRLDKMATNHARYILAGEFPNVALSHVETDLANPFFTGKEPWDRARHVGFLKAQDNTRGVGEDLSGGVMSTSMLSESEKVARYMELLLSAPYHAMDMLAPRTQMGVSVSWPENSGIPNKLPLTNGSVDLSPVVMAVSPGSPIAGANQVQIHQWPVDDVLTWPCNSTSNIVLTHMIPETVDVFGGNRDYIKNPVGTPFYVVARHGSGLRIASQKLTEISSGAVIPLLPPRYGDQEKYPGTDQINTSAELMDWSFIMPDVPLEGGKRYRMEVTATINGKSVNKVVEFVPQDNLFR